jgi:hypothetical protein
MKNGIIIRFVSLYYIARGTEVSVTVFSSFPLCLLTDARVPLHLLTAKIITLWNLTCVKRTQGVAHFYVLIVPSRVMKRCRSRRRRSKHADNSRKL